MIVYESGVCNITSEAKNDLDMNDMKNLGLASADDLDHHAWKGEDCRGYMLTQFCLELPG